MSAPFESELRRYERLKAQRASWEEHWQEVAELMLPRRADFQGKRPPGAKRQEKVFDATGQHALRILASALHGMLTNPAQPWFELTSGDPETDREDESKAWLELARDELAMAFADPAAGFYPQVHELYLDLAAFGTGVMFVEERADGVRFSTRHLAECVLGEGEDGRIDTVIRRFTLSARQALDRFGKQAGPRAQQAARSPDRADDEVEHLHVVAPRNDFAGPRSAAKDKRFASYYVELESRHLCSESGFDVFPFMAPRWEKLAGETYGRSPAMVALPDVKTLNAIVRTVLKGAQKAVDPPVSVPDDGVSGPINLSPAAVNFVRADYARQGLGIQPIALGARVDLGMEMIQQYRASIRSALMTDQLMFDGNSPDMPDGLSRMTATEVMRRTEEKLRVLGPMLGRIQGEFLGPMIDRVLGILVRRGQVAAPPAALQSRRIDVRYISPIARAQRMSEGEGLLRLLDVMRPLAAVEPSVADAIDFDQVPRVLADVFAAPSRILRSEAEIAKIRAQRAQATQAPASSAPPAAEQPADPLAGLAQALGGLDGLGLA